MKELVPFFFLLFISFFLFFIISNLFVTWVDRDDALGPIHHHSVAMLNETGCVFYPNNCWNFKRTRHDRGMRRTAAFCRDKSLDILFIQLCGVTGRKIFSD